MNEKEKEIQTYNQNKAPKSVKKEIDNFIPAEK